MDQAEKSSKVLTDLQAYKVMHTFLDDLWLPRKNDFNSEFPVLLGSMSLLIDDMPADQAQWVYWERCLGTRMILSEEEAFDAMLDFLEMNRNYSEEDEIAIVINIIKSSLDGWRLEWHRRVQRIISM